MTTGIIDRDTFDRRLHQLGAKSGGAGLPRRRRDRAILLESVVRSLDSGRSYSQVELDDALQAWLARRAPALGCDHVALRRELVDTGVLERPADGSEYRVTGATAYGFHFEPAPRTP